jgi:CRISPR-associated endonuclease Csy4
MGFYREITLLPNPEVSINFLWSKVFQQIHLGLVEVQDSQKQSPIGISFPGYAVGEKYSLLGGKCRLFAGDEATLARFDAAKWLARLSDYVHCTGIRPVPEKVAGYAAYQRLQPKLNKERLARRYARRHKVSYEEALRHYSAMADKTVTVPFIRLKSLSSEQTFCVWIKKSMASQPADGAYNCYGLSASATVPEF